MKLECSEIYPPRRSCNRHGYRTSFMDPYYFPLPSNCLDVCTRRMAADSWSCWSGAPCGGGGWNIYHVKCLDATSIVPINGKRFAFVSQLGTTGLDPDFGQMTPYTNISACLRKIFYYVLNNHVLLQFFKFDSGIFLIY